MSSQARKRTKAGTQAGSSQNGASSQAASQLDDSDAATELSQFVPTKFSEFHRAILNAFLECTIMNAREVRALFMGICEAFRVTFPNDTTDFYRTVAQTIGTINQRMKKYRMIIKKVSSETTVEPYYCLVNQSLHDVHREQSLFTVPELEYLQDLVVQILQSPERSLSQHQALRGSASSSNSKPVSAATAQGYLEKLEALQFVCRSGPNDQLRLGPRALAELEPLIRDRQPDAVSQCVFCQGIILDSNIRCDKCQKKCHLGCLIRSIDPVKENATLVTCVGCREPFPLALIQRCRRAALAHCRHAVADEDGQGEDDASEEY